MDRNGGCCIARWTDAGGHVPAGYDKTKMDMIMLKFRPIAPKPVSPVGTPAATSDSSNNNNSPRDGPHAKGSTRGRKKNNNNMKSMKSNSSSSRRKRKSSSPDNRTAGEGEVDRCVTLLPLFPEAPDLSPTKQQQEQQGQGEGNNVHVPIWLNFNDGHVSSNNAPQIENNYGNCHWYGW